MGKPWPPSASGGGNEDAHCCGTVADPLDAAFMASVAVRQRTTAL